jgi:hypothetical protein
MFACMNKLWTHLKFKLLLGIGGIDQANMFTRIREKLTDIDQADGNGRKGFPVMLLKERVSRELYNSGQKLCQATGLPVWCRQRLL